MFVSLSLSSSTASSSSSSSSSSSQAIPLTWSLQRKVGYWLGWVSWGVVGLLGSLWLYMVFMKHGTSIQVGTYLKEIHPFYWGSLGVAFSIGFSVIGAGW
ncbi:hypothetical protein HMI56_002819 [Coelomomyces lativittatus]|nr:hypothetical protein HMI56_002819 [Coelomomyces lativittatus]